MILLTGFEPFGGFTANPAGEVAKALDGRAFGTEVVRGAILPVHHAAAARSVNHLVDERNLRRTESVELRIAQRDNAHHRLLVSPVARQEA